MELHVVERPANAFQQGLTGLQIQAVAGPCLGPVGGSGHGRWRETVVASLHVIAEDVESCGLDAADLRKAADAAHVTIRRERHRHVCVVMTRVIRPEGPDVTGAGVFLTRADAEEAQAVITAKSVACWIEELPIAV
ncbi:hypothetical protein ACQKM2_13715 [Streptomyces sp. NPDC004126]|uniref:hypothetical protein n=1 Tax=Streptomyces sp. NPDC004126 TaxID=3390695 RepID=UPI003D03F428